MTGQRGLAARAAGAMAAGAVIPLALGVVNLLYGWALWLTLAMLLIYRFSPKRRAIEQHHDAHHAFPWDLIAAFAALVALAWPALARPALDRESLVHHMPNVATWAAHHGVWVTDSMHWWYPPASDIFATGLYAIGGGQVLGFTGVLPAALIVLTLRAAADHFSGRPEPGTAVGCALLATPVAAAQIGSLQSEIWIASLFLTAVREFQLATIGTLALASPNGAIYAVVAGLTWLKNRLELVESLCITIAAAGLWAFHDLLLVRHSPTAVSGAILTSISGTNVQSNPLAALGLISAVSLHAGWVWATLLALGVASIVLESNAYLRWAALAATCAFLAVRFGYAPSGMQLALVDSLRYALPLAALGALLLASLGTRPIPYVVLGASIATLYGIGVLWIGSFGDPGARWAPFAVALATPVIAIALRAQRTVTRAALGSAVLFALAMAAAWVRT